MPDMDGYETAELIRSREKTRHTPIIFLTAYDRNEVAVSKGYALGAVDYLVKPFVPEILKAKVSVFVELYRKGERLRQLERAEFEHRLEEAHQRWETEHLRAEAEREKQRAAELADLDRRKNEFLAMLCHELRNPLAPLKNALKIMRLHKPVGEAVEQAHAIADRQLQQLGRLVEDLLDLSRIGSGKMRLEKQPTDLGKIVAHAVEVARPLIEARNHQLTVSVPTEPLPLEGDAARLEQVAVNLLTNAAKYTEPGGHIWVKAQRDGASLILSVRDNGIGLSADILPHLFDLFMQAESGSQGGLGIGLNLVRSLVRLHGGDVYAYSDGPGKGSEFVVRLPARLPGSG
jgi:signal transduction histidine kinase